MSSSPHAGVATNPILPGFHPDPSICRVGDDYYLVTSTFEYFPGLPIQHSRDLVNWRRLGHELDRREQLCLAGVRSSGGLYAPTIRWHDGIFYVVCTLVGDPPPIDGVGPRTGNFVVTATDPAGPWSKPHRLGEPDSFDPSLLFDGDETWFCATCPNPAAAVSGGTEIWVQAFDVEIATVDGRALSTTAAGGFTGMMLGPYVFSGDLDDSVPSARFAWFEYRADDCSVSGSSGRAQPDHQGRNGTAASPLAPGFTASTWWS